MSQRLSATGTGVLLAAALVAVLTAPHAPAQTLMVSGQANIFGAGHTTAPNPGGGTGGVLPPSYSFTAGSGQMLQFSSVTGTVTLDAGSFPAGNGPDGGTNYTQTDVTSFGGIAGIVHTNRTMFLTGVFLGATEPADPAPARLTVTAPVDFTTLSPLVNQPFFIGDGRTSSSQVQTFFVPAGASRLYLGFADSFNGSTITGQPGYYGDNGGSLTATFSIQPVPEPASLLLASAVWVGIGWVRRRR